MVIDGVLLLWFIPTALPAAYVARAFPAAFPVRRQQLECNRSPATVQPVRSRGNLPWSRSNEGVHA